MTEQSYELALLTTFTVQTNLPLSITNSHFFLYCYLVT